MRIGEIHVYQTDLPVLGGLAPCPRRRSTRSTPRSSKWFPTAAWSAGPRSCRAVRSSSRSPRSLPQTREDSGGGDILAVAIVHLGATAEPRLLEAVWTAGNFIEEHYDPENGIAVDGGRFDLPSGPGLGVDPAEDRIGTLIASFS